LLLSAGATLLIVVVTTDWPNMPLNVSITVSATIPDISDRSSFDAMGLIR
jgi:hypothetical protein